MTSTPETFERVFDDYVLGARVDAGRQVITTGDVERFAALTGDRHPAHTDQEFADAEFGGRLVHGALTFSVVVGLTVEYNRLAVAYGYDRIRFPNPVLAGDTVSATAEVIETREHRNPEIGLVVKQYTGTNQRDEVVLVAQHTLAVQRAPRA